MIPLTIEGRLGAAIDALDWAITRHPPTSSARGEGTWFPLARKLALELSRQATTIGVSIDWDIVPNLFHQILIASKRIIPIDLISCGEGLLGAESVIAHIVAKEEELPGRILNALEEEEAPLRRIAHVCTYYPGSTSLHQMDVVSATLGLGNKLAIEHYFYPEQKVAMGLFGRADLDILHFECHGASSDLQIDTPYGVPFDVRQLYSSDGPSIYFFLGCNAGSDIDSTAPYFVQEGAKASIGSYCGFLSGGDSGAVSLSAYYDELYQGLISGKRLGDAVRAGRKAAFPGRVYYCAWLLFGNPNVRFSTKAFGGAEPKPRLRRTG
ncbi:MAG TPA: hypothetical protein VLV54_03125 [Thermoanaerobaculia bacterium]|nr:hypothetical protein [Thermoanaerobaculia bacterium]